MSEIVKINIPAKAEHLLVVRLAASGICSRLGMAIEQMEDVKAAVAEACIIMIHDQAGYERLDVCFEYSDHLWVSATGETPGDAPHDDEIDADFSLALLEALTEKTEVGAGFVRFKARGGSKR
jgi:serine/threonine-protein kinase RsbW